MFGLVQGLWQHWNQKAEFNILILGLDNAGKTTFLELAKICAHVKDKELPSFKLPKIHSTVGLNIGKIVFSDIILNFWDLGGHSELQCLWENYYAEAHAIIYILDTSDFDRIQESKAAFDKVISNESTTGLPVLFIANNKNGQKCLSHQEIEDVFDFKNTLLTNYKPFHFTMISQLNGRGIKECLDWIQISIKNNAHLRPPIGLDI